MYAEVRTFDRASDDTFGVEIRDDALRVSPTNIPDGLPRDLLSESRVALHVLLHLIDRSWIPLIAIITAISDLSS